MNTKSFEQLDGSTISDYLRSKGITEELKREWYRTIIENKDLFEDKNFNEISDIVEALAIEGIDGDIVNMTVCTIANDNDIELDPDIAKCFMMFAKGK